MSYNYKGWRVGKISVISFANYCIFFINRLLWPQCSNHKSASYYVDSQCLWSISSSDRINGERAKTRIQFASIAALIFEAFIVLALLKVYYTPSLWWQISYSLCWRFRNFKATISPVLVYSKWNLFNFHSVRTNGRTIHWTSSLVVREQTLHGVIPTDRPTDGTSPWIMYQHAT